MPYYWQNTQLLHIWFDSGLVKVFTCTGHKSPFTILDTYLYIFKHRCGDIFESWKINSDVKDSCIYKCHQSSSLISWTYDTLQTEGYYESNAGQSFSVGINITCVRRKSSRKLSGKRERRVGLNTGTCIEHGWRERERERLKICKLICSRHYLWFPPILCCLVWFPGDVPTFSPEYLP